MTKSRTTLQVLSAESIEIVIHLQVDEVHWRVAQRSKRRVGGEDSYSTFRYNAPRIFQIHDVQATTEVHGPDLPRDVRSSRGFDRKHK